MDPERPDRRVKRTRRALHEALIGLILEKGYEAITVQDIADRADVGRSTFYAHFVDKDALLLGGFDALPAFRPDRPRDAPGDGAETLFEFSLDMFHHAHEQRRLFRALVGQRSGVLLVRQLELLLSDLVRVDLAQLDGLAPTRGPAHAGRPSRADSSGRVDSSARGRPRARDDRALELAVRFVVSSYLGLLTWWLEQPTTTTPEQMDAAFRALALPGLSGFLGIAPARSASPV